jgi:RNA polymerase sigma factor for flagellar operon FliA
LLDQWSRAQVASWEARSEADNKRTSIECGASAENPLDVDLQSRANLKELRTHLVDAISEFEERERLVATFYFYEGLTLKEIGKAFNLTEVRISQILNGALTKLWERLRGSSVIYGG